MRHGTHCCLTVTFFALVCSLVLCDAPKVFASSNPSKQPLVRKGAVMGLDPGIAVRFDDFGVPVFARLTVRVGGCINRRIQLGGDLRMDIWAGGDRVAQQHQYELGPVVTFFLVKGWFFRIFAHVGEITPFVLTSGLATGYEWGMGRFSGAGIMVGGDTDIRFDGHAPEGYSVFFSFYLSAYDLGTRRGRNEF